MAASINDKIIQAQNGGAPQPTTVSSARSISGTSLSCVALTNWPTTTAVHLMTYKKKTDGTMDRSTLCLWKGIVSDTTIGTLTLKGGTDAGNSVGDFVEAAPTSAQWQDLYDGLTQEHKVDGKHGDITADSLTINSGGSISLPAGSIDSDTLAESVKPNYQTDNSNSIANVTGAAVKLQMGWGQIAGTNVGNLKDTVTFPTAFTMVLGVTATLNGYGTSSAGTSIGGATGDWGAKSVSATAHNISTSGCIIELGQSTGTFTTGVYFYYSWVAWGII